MEEKRVYMAEENSYMVHCFSGMFARQKGCNATLAGHAPKTNPILMF